jgi:hypothetical protein
MASLPVITYFYRLCSGGVGCRVVSQRFRAAFLGVAGSVGRLSVFCVLSKNNVSISLRMAFWRVDFLTLYAVRLETRPRKTTFHRQRPF